MSKKPWYVRLPDMQFSVEAYSKFTSLAAEIRRSFVAFCSKHGFTDLDVHRGYFFVSGFFKVGEQWWYFTVGDVRYGGTREMLIRTAESGRDFRGGRNQSVRYGDDFEKSLLDIVRRREG